MPRNSRDGRHGLLEACTELVAQSLQLRRAQLRIVVRGDGRICFRELQLHEIDQAGKEGPCLISLLELCETAARNLLGDRLAAAEPDG